METESKRDQSRCQDKGGSLETWANGNIKEGK